MLEQIQWDFLWDDGPLERKLHLVNWATICSNKRKRLGSHASLLAQQGFTLQTELASCNGKGGFLEADCLWQI